MSCLGVHFSLSEREVDRLLGIGDDGKRLQYLQDVIEKDYFALHRDLLAESDKSWDAIHRALTDGLLTWEGGEYPLNHVILGGTSLYAADDFIMALKTPNQVKDVAGALPTITRDEFHRRYLAIAAGDYGFELSDEDFEYTWTWFEGVREFWLLAAAEGRYVLFTADQ